MCLFTCYMVRSLSSRACMLEFVFFHAFMLTSTCLDVHLRAYMHIFMLICVDRWVYMLRSMLSTCFMPSSMCLRALCHVFVLRLRPCLSCHVLLQPFCYFYRIFSCFGLMVRTRSRPYGLCHCPHTKAHIKRFGSPLFACLCLLASMLYACVSLSSLGFAMLDALSGLVVVWLHSTPIRLLEIYMYAAES